MRSSRKTSLMLAVAVAGFAQTSMAANNAVWQASPAGSFWNAPNWDNGGPYTPVAGDLLFFGTSSVTNTNNDFVGGSFGGLTFNTGASGFTLDGNDLTLTGPLVVNTAATG